MRRNCCHKNCACHNNIRPYSDDLMETACNNVSNYGNAINPNDCMCGFDEETDVFPTNFMYGQSYVPWQTMNQTFTPCVGLKMGTLFPELVSPYMPGDSMRFNEYVAATNEIGKGCNKC